MKDVIIIGAGGHSAELDDYLNYSNSNSRGNKINIMGYLDDDPGNYSRYKFSAPLLGGIKDHKVRSDVGYLMGIANLKYRKYFVERFLLEGAQFLSFVHDSAYVSGSSYLGQGVVVAPMANIGPNVRIGDFTVINSRSSIGHDTVVGKFNVISPNVCFSGFTKVGDENLFGINSATIPGLKVGSRNKVAAGMVLDKNIGDDSTVFYRYKERVLAIPKSVND